jgi:hypothetical protein
MPQETKGIKNNLTVEHVVEVKGIDEYYQVEVESCYRNVSYAVAVEILNQMNTIKSFTWE